MRGAAATAATAVAVIAGTCFWSLVAATVVVKSVVRPAARREWRETWD